VAIKVVMVIMTFQQILQVLPVATVLENNFYITGRLSTLWIKKVPRLIVFAFSIFSFFK